uniref:Smg4_UPF3 domain-containing protein n=1 Tax=Ascaris lumbricoides TaxID=6252 RepID=A0A0M3I303_ASCLU
MDSNASPQSVGYGSAAYHPSCGERPTKFDGYSGISMKDDASSTTSTSKEKVKRKAPIKIVLRRLPRGMTWKELQMQLDPLPETEFSQFVAVGVDAPKIAFPRAYFVFKNDEDIIAFRDRFNGYVFIDSQGSESMGLVELAPNPKVSRHKLEDSKKRDKKCATIDTEVEYKKFVDDRENPPKPVIVPIEQRIKEIEMKEKNALENAVQETPLTQYMIRKNEEKFRRIQEKRRTREEERRARLQRLYDKEQRERAERNETKKITEFRNSKFERAALKEKSNDRDRERGDRGSTASKKNREDAHEEQELPPRKSERSFRNERIAKKERDNVTGARERVIRVERTKKCEHADNNVKAEDMKPSRERIEKGVEVNDDGKTNVSVIRSPKIFIASAAVPKETSEKGVKGSEKDEAVVPKQPRRAKVPVGADTLRGGVILAYYIDARSSRAGDISTGCAKATSCSCCCGCRSGKRGDRREQSGHGKAVNGYVAKHARIR